MALAHCQCLMRFATGVAIIDEVPETNWVNAIDDACMEAFRRVWAPSAVPDAELNLMIADDSPVAWLDIRHTGGAARRPLKRRRRR